MRIVLALVVLFVLAALVFFVLEPDDAGQDAEVTSEATQTTDGTDDESAASDTGTAADEPASQTSETAADAMSQEGSVGSDTDQADAEPAAAQDEASPDAADVGSDTPSFDIVRVETNGDAVMAGRATPGATVQIYSHDGLVAETTANDSGDWVIVLEEPLAPGSHQLWLRSEGADGAVSESRNSVAMLVPEPDESSTSSAETADASSDATDDVIAVLVPRDDDGGVEILQEPEDGVGLAGGGGLSLHTLDYNQDGEVALSGKGAPGTEIRAYVDGELVGRTLADNSGDWRMTLDTPVDLGLHALRIDQVDEAGVVLARVETPFDRESLQLPASAEPVVIIQPGNNLWTIARHSYGSGVHYTHIYEANQGQIADPHLIYPGQIFVLPTIN